MKLKILKSLISSVIVDPDVLTLIQDEIDKLEKTKLDVQQYTQTDEDYMRWAWLALILFVIEIVLRYTVLRRIP